MVPRLEGDRPVGYGITSISVVMILVGVYYLATWNFPQEEKLPRVS
jgi:hypothetical protein